MFERRLPCFGCGVGWCCFLLGFLCPIIWYVAALLYCCKYYNRDPRERPGLAASAFLVSFPFVRTLNNFKKNISYAVYLPFWLRN
ncbi:hypothetical protein PR202_gb24678 [Eleusine coracana subsp. coracana]|uniref:Uncharacterized protein n=1 Tax=Eleusine coracana subsp. coracana TaxID=191504 RepID=A0AAV5FN47_ELECO|nr:hypothetical protein PR202_gb24678 [Eleusine coracana subsp. coracana]